MTQEQLTPAATDWPNLSHPAQAQPAPRTIASSIAAEWLRRLDPPEQILHVGAGAGTGAMHVWRSWPVQRALILDANASRLGWTKPLLEQHAEWRAMPALLSDTDAQTAFHHASNPDEDGLLPPEPLAALWSNLRATGQEARPGVRLETLLAETGFDAHPTDASGHTWVLIDCLPAARILRGAGDQLSQWSLVWCRVLLRPLAATHQEATLQALEDLLAPFAFRCIQVSEGNHPGVGDAIFARDWKAVLHQGRSPRNARGRMADTTEAGLSESAHQAEEFEEQQTHDIEVRAEDAKALEQLRQDMIELSGERDQQRTLAAERQSQIQQLEAQLASQSEQLRTLQSQLAERERHQQQFGEEMIKAEAQIELIKDLLLRDPSL